VLHQIIKFVLTNAKLTCLFTVLTHPCVVSFLPTFRSSSAGHDTAWTVCRI